MSGWLVRVGIVALPIVVLMICGSAMNYASGRSFPPDPSRPGKPLKPLNQRYFGYDANAIAAYFGGLDRAGKDAERRFLQYDLGFPILFAIVLSTGIRISASLAGQPFSPLWGIALVGIGLLADWTENLTQLRLLAGAAASVPFDSFRPTLASVATMTKLWAETLVWLRIAAYAIAGV